MIFFKRFITIQHSSSRSKTSVGLAILSLVLLSGVSGCASNGGVKQFDNSDLQGNWFGSSQSGQTTTKWINARTPEGDFELEFKVCNKNKVTMYQVKRGSWLVKDKAYQTTTTELTDGQKTWQPGTENRKYVERYTINRLKNNVLYYKNADGKKFTATKISPSYRLNCKQDPKPLRSLSSESMKVTKDQPKTPITQPKL